jgi:hypothetical protein
MEFPSKGEAVARLRLVKSSQGYQLDAQAWLPKLSNRLRFSHVGLFCDVQQIFCNVLGVVGAKRCYVRGMFQRVGCVIDIKKVLSLTIFIVESSVNANCVIPLDFECIAFRLTVQANCAKLTAGTFKYP